MSLTQQLGTPDRKEVSAGSVDQKLDAAQTAASGAVAAKAKGLMGMVRSFARRAKDVLNADVADLAKKGGAYVAEDARATAARAAGAFSAVKESAKSGLRTAAMVGAAMAPVAPALAADAPEGLAVSGARTEMVSPLAAGAGTETVLLARNDLPTGGNRVDEAAPKGGERAADSLTDPAYRLSYELMKAGGDGHKDRNEGEPKPAPAAATDKPKLLGGEALALLIRKKEIPEGFSSYAQYVIEMENLRKTNPAAYERFSREFGVVAINVWEARYTQEYPVCVVDPFHVGPQYDLPSTQLRTDYDASSLKGSLRALFLDRYNEAYALEQFGLGNPAFAGKGGKYDPAVIDKKIGKQTKHVERWEKRSDQGMTVTVPSSGKTVTQLAAENLNAFHAFQKRYPNVRVNAWAKEKEDLAVLSWTFVANGVKTEGGKVISASPWINKKTYDDGNSTGVDPYLLQGDLSQIAIAYQARLKPEELRGTYELEVVRVKDLDALVAKTRAAIGDAQFNEYYQYVPAGFGKDSSEHKLSVLRMVKEKPEDFFINGAPGKDDEIRAVAKEIADGLSTTSRTPLISFEMKLEALDKIGLIAKPGTPERETQVALLKNLQERCFEQALLEIRPKDDVESAVLAVEHQQAKAKADKSEAEGNAALARGNAALAAADRAEKRNVATKEAAALFHRWEQASDAEKPALKQELEQKLKVLIGNEMANPVKDDPYTLQALLIYQKRISS